jgi:hypothetical protein
MNGLNKEYWLHLHDKFDQEYRPIRLDISGSYKAVCGEMVPGNRMLMAVVELVTCPECLNRLPNRGIRELANA